MFFFFLLIRLNTYILWKYNYVVQAQYYSFAKSPNLGTNHVQISGTANPDSTSYLYPYLDHIPRSPFDERDNSDLELVNNLYIWILFANT